MVTIGGREVDLKLDMGAMRLLKKAGYNVFSLGQSAADPDFMATLIAVCAERAGQEVTDEEIDSMTLSEIQSLNNWIMDVYKALEEDQGNAESQD